jgi:hypothetical protein
LGILRSAFSGITEYSENVDTPPNRLISLPFRLNPVPPPGRVPVRRISMPAVQSAGRPPVQYSHSPQLSRHNGTTWSSGCTSFTPGPTAVTTPDPSCPRIAGSGALRSPFITCRSLWQTPPTAM